MREWTEQEKQARQEYLEKREQAMREFREHNAKLEAKGAVKPTIEVAPAESGAAEESEPSPRPVIKYIRSLQDAPEGDAQDFEVKGGCFKLQDQIAEDSEETGCLQYVVLNEGDQYCVWRLPR